MLILGVEVEPLNSGAVRFHCDAHGAPVTATLKPNGWTKPFHTCSCEMAALQLILDAIQAAQSNGNLAGLGVPQVGSGTGLKTPQSSVQIRSPSPASEAALSNGRAEAHKPNEEPLREQIRNGNGHDDLSLRVPPHNGEAEQSVLGAILIAPEAVSLVIDWLLPGAFYREPHRNIYRAMMTLKRREEPIDVVTLAVVLRAMNAFESSGGMGYLAELGEVVPTAQNIVYYAKIVQQKAILRDLAARAGEIQRRALEESPSDVAAYLTDASTQLVNIPYIGGSLNGVEYADRQGIDAYDAYLAMLGEAREYSWERLIRDGCTAVLSALIGSGKTTFAMNLARAWGMGGSFLDRACRQSRTFVVVSPKEYEAWTETIGFWELKGMVFITPSTNAHFGDREKTVKWFDSEMRRLDCRTFVLDTLFDFFGMPPNNSGDSNRIVMNEQTPLLQMVRERNYSGLVTGHSPKSEAKAIDPRDPEEAFGGHTAWTAQHRMRMTIRRKSQGVNSFLTGRGGYGDKGILKEELLMFDEATRLDSLGGLFSDHLGEAAMPGVVDTLRECGEPVSMPQLIEAMGKAPKWVKAGVKSGRKRGLIDSDAVKGKRDSKYWLAGQKGELL